MKAYLEKKSDKTPLLVVMLFLMFSMYCKKAEEKKIATIESKPSLTGVVLFAVGDIKSAGKKLKSGDMISENEIIQTGKKSTCDIQIRESESEIIIRMKSESVLELKMKFANQRLIPSPLVKTGNIMVNVSKKLKAEENFQIVTPTTVAGVRGTKFEVNVKADGSTVISVSEGTVSTKMRLQEIDDFPTDVQEKSKLINSVNDLLNSKEQILTVGQRMEISNKETNALSQETGLAEIIKQVKLTSKNDSEILNTIDKNVEKIDLASKLTLNLKIEKSLDKDLQANLKEFNELIAIEKNKLESSESFNQALKERHEKNQETLSRRIEEITGKKFETLILKSGKKVTGSIFLEGDTYHIITANGEETYKEDEVEGMEL